MSPDHSNHQNDDFHNPYASPEQAEHAEDALPDGTPPTLVWAILSVAVGFAVGAGSRYVRPMIPGPVHYESLVAGILLVIFAAVTAIRFSLLQGRPRLAIILALVVVTWLTYAIGWFLVHGRFWDNLAFAACMGAVVSSVVALVTLFASRLVTSWLRRT